MTLTFVLHYSKVLNQSWKYKESIKSSHEYVVGVKVFSQCVSMIELNAWEDDWLVTIKVLQEGKRRQRRWQKQGRGN
jgi:hypothetical protein